MYQEQEKTLKRIANLISQLQIELFNLTGSDQFVSEKNVMPVKKEQQLSYMLHELGISTGTKGYDYIKFVLLNIIKEANTKMQITKAIYPEVAIHFHTTSTRVERNIRHAITTAFKKADLELLQLYFPRTTSDREKVTNNEFLYRLAEYIEKGY